MAQKFVIRKLEGSFLSKDGRTCQKLERAKTFTTKQDALNALIVYEGEDRPKNIYVSPKDIETRVWENWEVVKVEMMSLVDD